MNKYEKGQQIPISGITTITGVQKNKSGEPIYNTDRGCSMPELLIEHLEMKPYSNSSEPTPKQEDKPEYKIGDLARIIGNTAAHHFPNGEIVRIVKTGSATGVNAECLNGCNRWGVHFADIEPYTEPEQEPVKLYCVKDSNVPWVKRGLTKGKVYEFDGHRINYNDGKSAYFEDFDDWKRLDCNYAACLVPLVKRPAKVGEWIYVDRKEAEEVSFVSDNGNISQVDRVEDDGRIYTKGWRTMHYLRDEDCYLVLDGYQPEPEYLNMKVVCTKGGEYHTAGKVYEVKDGILNDNSGRFNYNGTPVKTLGELSLFIVPQFIEFKGE